MTIDTDWHAWRGQGLGASEVPALLGLSTFDSPWSLWAKKVGLLPASTEETERQRLGHDLEPVIAGRFTRATGLDVAGEQTWCAHKQKPWARATIDAFVVERGPGADALDDALGVAEWKSDGGLGTWRKDGIPARVQAQCQWQMFVTGLDMAYLGVFHSGFRFEVYELHRDERDIDFMVARAERFWVDHVRKGEPPPPDGSDATARAIGQVYGREEPGKRVELPAHLAGSVTGRAQLKADIKEWEDRLKRLDNELKAAMGDAEVATANGVPIYSLRAQERRGIDTKALERDHPEIAEKYRTVTEYRVLRPATKKDKAVAA